MMVGDAHGDAYKSYVRVSHHSAIVAVPAGDSEAMRGGSGGLLVSGADGPQLHLGKSLKYRDVHARAPALGMAVRSQVAPGPGYSCGDGRGAFCGARRNRREEYL